MLNNALTLSTRVSNLFGIGDKYAKLLDVNLGIKTVEDLLNHFPQRYEDYSNVKNFEDIQNGELVTIIGKIIETKNIFTRRIKIQEIIIEDVLSVIHNRAKLTFFNQPFLLQSLRKDMIIAVSGTAEKPGVKLQFKSPEYELIKFPIPKFKVPNENLVHTGRLTPIYPETRGISSKWLRARIFPLITQIQSLITEFLPENILKQENLIDLQTAYKNVHYPESSESLAKANLRLGFDELLIAQITSSLKKQEWRKGKSKKIQVDNHEKDIQNLISSLPFTLTSSQSKSIGEIFSDIAQSKPMNRLLEGDVGSGKTVVAAIAMYLAYLNGFSSALMCPTEILANQHYATINKLLGKYRVPIYLVTSSANKVLNSKSKNLNSVSIYIGTHALIQDNVDMPNLNLVVIDEQHRFGVEQRGKLVKKGETPHVLTMTATPIPRTIALTFYGNLDLSVLSDMPQKKLIKTWVVPPEKRERAYAWISKQIKENHSQAFIICPFIEPSETMESVKSARLEFESSKKIFPNLKLELLTGKTKSAEKDKIMKNFEKNKFHILVSTPVVEVGIDIPEASIILIEGAERFGLAQLHQLRGRVGRRGQAAFCLLFASDGKSKETSRLKFLETVDNGLRLAEIDLKIRGSGNIFGKEQHGIKEFKKASLSDLYLVEKTKTCAEGIVSSLDKFPVLKKKLESGKITNIINN